MVGTGGIGVIKGMRKGGGRVGEREDIVGRTL